MLKTWRLLTPFFAPGVYVRHLRRRFSIKVAFYNEGSDRRWVRQAVMGVLRWKDLPGTGSSRHSLGNGRSIFEVGVFFFCDKNQPQPPTF